MVLSRCHTVLIVLVGWCLLGQTVLADIPATQPAAKTQPTETAQPEAEKQPTTLADIVTFSLQDEQLVADVHWQPQGRLMVVKLLDIPGDVRVQNLGAHGRKAGGGNNVIVMISRNNGQDQDFNQIIINTSQFLPQPYNWNQRSEWHPR